MNFSGLQRSTVLGRMLRAPLRLIPCGAVFPILQGRLKGKKWIVGSCDHGCWLGSYEYEKQQLFAKSITPGSTVYDIGAHAGFYTLLAAEITGPRGNVISFEPLPRNLAFLKRHVRINACANVTVVEAAVSDRDGTALFDVTDGHLMGHLSPDGALEVRTVRLDTLVRDGAIPFPQCVKMDIEGEEYDALRGAEELLRASRPTVFLATHNRAVHLRCCDFLGQLGYRLRPVRSTEEVSNADEIVACGSD